MERAFFLRSTAGAIPTHERFGAMLTKSIRLAALLPFFQSDSPAGGGGQGDPPTPPTPPVDPSLGEAGKKAIQDERDAREGHRIGG